MNIIILSLVFQCMVDQVHHLSGVEILKDRIVHHGRKTKKSDIEKLLKSTDSDSRLLSIIYLETRLRARSRRGDRGKACGVFQIHARHSYPLFSRKRGYVGWEESENQTYIQKECSKLEKVDYSIKTMGKLISMMDRKKLHVCHHNSGFYGKCNTWYKKRVDLIVTYLELSKILCDERLLKWL